MKNILHKNIFRHISRRSTLLVLVLVVFMTQMFPFTVSAQNATDSINAGDFDIKFNNQSVVVTVKEGSKYKTNAGGMGININDLASEYQLTGQKKDEGNHVICGSYRGFGNQGCTDFPRLYAASGGANLCPLHRADGFQIEEALNDSDEVKAYVYGEYRSIELSGEASIDQSGNRSASGLFRIRNWSSSLNRCIGGELQVDISEGNANEGPRSAGEYIASNAIRLFTVTTNYIQLDRPEWFQVVGSQKCPNLIKVTGREADGDRRVRADHFVMQEGAPDDSNRIDFKPECKVQSRELDIRINTANIDAPPKTPEELGEGAEGGASGPDPESCEVQSKTPLSWILCPIINGVSWGINMFRGLIEDTLNFDLTASGSASNNLRLVWGRFRNMANILFVIAFLYMIISQVIAGRF